MTLKYVAERLRLNVLTGHRGLDRVVQGGYAGDLLSDVIANATAGSVWVTMHTHKNIVGVAVLKNLAGIIVVQGRQPDPVTVQKASDEHVVMMVSDRPAFETTGSLSALLAGSAPPG
jgi:hypothetical protein